jgi:exopolysaccharide biosynthesis operon protein EpsL
MIEKRINTMTCISYKKIPYFTAITLAVYCSVTSAQSTNGLQLKAAYTVQQSSNIFNNSYDPDQLLLETNRDNPQDQISITTLGVGYRGATSLQKYGINVAVIDYRYQNFQKNNLTANNYDADFEWAITPRLTGVVAASQAETQNNSDSTNLTQNNVRKDISRSLKGRFQPGGFFNFLFGASQTSQTNDLPQKTKGDFRTQAYDAGVQYLDGTGNAYTYTLSNSAGTYINRPASAGNLIDDHYNVLENTLKLHHVINGRSKLDISLSHMNRTYPTFEQRNFSGLNSSATFDWALTGKSNIAITYASTSSEYPAPDASYARTDRIKLSPVWNFSPKLQGTFTTEWSQTRYDGSPTAVTSDRLDTNKNTQLVLVWLPYDKFTLTTSFSHYERSTNIPGLDYSANQFSLSAQYNY